MRHKLQEPAEALEHMVADIDTAAEVVVEHRLVGIVEAAAVVAVASAQGFD